MDKKKKQKVYSFHAENSPLKSWSLYLGTYSLPFCHRATSADTQSHPGITTPEMTEEWTFTSVFGNYHNYHEFPGKPHGTCPIHLGSWSNYAKNRNYLGCETAKLAKLKGSPLTTMGILWMRLQFQAPSPFSKFITQPVAFFGAKRPAAGWFQRILMKFNQIMEHVGRDISS